MVFNRKSQPKQQIQTTDNGVKVTLDQTRVNQFEQVSQSEALRPWSERKLSSLNWFKVFQYISLSMSACLGVLSFSWLLLPVEPALYRLLVALIKYILPIAAAIAMSVKLALFIRLRPHDYIDGEFLTCFLVGAVLSLYFHSFL